MKQKDQIFCLYEKMGCRMLRVKPVMLNQVRNDKLFINMWQPFCFV